MIAAIVADSLTTRRDPRTMAHRNCAPAVIMNRHTGRMPVPMAGGKVKDEAKSEAGAVAVIEALLSRFAH